MKAGLIQRQGKKVPRVVGDNRSLRERCGAESLLEPCPEKCVPDDNLILTF